MPRTFAAMATPEHIRLELTEAERGLLYTLCFNEFSVSREEMNNAKSVDQIDFATRHYVMLDAILRKLGNAR